MERLKKGFILLVIISLSLILSHCTKYKEEAPFFDGLILEYRVGVINKIFNVQVLNNNRFKIIKTEKRAPLRDKVEEYFVNSYGKVYKSSSKPYKGKFSPIWIPVHEMEIGDTFDDGYTVTKKDKWKKWKVLVIKTPDIKEDRYFELNTGYLVGLEGRFGMSYEAVLINTNADIPTVEE